MSSHAACALKSNEYSAPQAWDLPTQVQIREVGPRDGFQNEPDEISTADKIRLINGLAETGVRRIEVGSFVRPGVIPQLADTAAVIQGMTLPDGVKASVLVPNHRGLENALNYRERFQEAVMFLSASETHNLKNLNRTVEASLATAVELIEQSLEAGLRPVAGISTAFGCPYEGRVPPGRVFDLARALASAGAAEISFGDTTGMANPLQVREFFEAARDGLPPLELTAHFHNTRGQGLANVLAALEAGVTSFEASFGEIGGCPVPAGSTGNVGSEDLVSMLQQMGIDTGIDLDRLLGVSRDLQTILGRPLGSHVLSAGPVLWANV